MLEGEALEEVESFTYLGTVVDKQGVRDADVKDRKGEGSFPPAEEHLGIL